MRIPRLEEAAVGGLPDPREAQHRYLMAAGPDVAAAVLVPNAVADLQCMKA